MEVTKVRLISRNKRNKRAQDLEDYPHLNSNREYFKGQARAAVGKSQVVVYYADGTSRTCHMFDYAGDGS